MDLRSVQKPLKEKYRDEPGSSRITLRAQGTQTGTPVACSVDIGRAIYEAQAHKGVGGVGTAACSGDLLLERVMNLGENRIEMRIPQSVWFPHDLCFPHS